MRKGLVLCIINTHMMKILENFLSSRVLATTTIYFHFLSQFLHPPRRRSRGHCHSLLSDGEFVKKRVVDNPLERKGGFENSGRPGIVSKHTSVCIYLFFCTNISLSLSMYIKLTTTTMMMKKKWVREANLLSKKAPLRFVCADFMWWSYAYYFWPSEEFSF